MKTIGEATDFRPHAVARRKAQIRRVDQLGGKPHDLEHERIAFRLDARQLLLLPERELADQLQVGRSTLRKANSSSTAR